MEPVVVAIISGLVSICVALLSGLLVQRRTRAEANKLVAEGHHTDVDSLSDIISAMRAEVACLREECVQLRKHKARATNAVRLLNYILAAPIGEERTRIDYVICKLAEAAGKTGLGGMP